MSRSTIIMHEFWRSLSVAVAICWVLALHANSIEPRSELRDQIKVAAVQISGYDKGDLPREDYDPTTLLIPYIDQAGRDAADIVVFPEYVLGRIAVPGPQTDQLAKAAKANKIYVVVGCWEVFDNDTFANTILIFGRDGEICGKYHKTHAAVDHHAGDPPWSKPPVDKSHEWMLKHDPEWVMQRGEDLPVFDLDFGRVGILTCYDGWFPEPARVLSLRGAELILWVNGRGGSVEDYVVKSTMFQSHVAMVATNQAYGAGTMIGDAPDRIIARAPDMQEAYLSGTIDLKQLRQLRSSSRNFAQRRPDLYRPLVSPKATSPEPGQPQIAE